MRQNVLSGKHWKKWITVKRAGITLGTLALIITILGHVFQSDGFFLGKLFEELWANLGTELLSIAITILIIDELYQKRDEQREKEQLILQMGSPDAAFSQEAIRKLRSHGWLIDGSLRGVDLSWANLEKGYLWNADLQKANFSHAKLSGTYLTKANLSGAIIKEDQFKQLRNLRGAIMPSGDYYDGRFNLEGDFHLAREKGVNVLDPNAMAKFYKVSVETYLKGQEIIKSNT